MPTPEELRNMSPDDLIEAVAQMLFDRTEVCLQAEDDSITQPIRDKYHHKANAYMAAAEFTRRMINPI